MDPTVNRGSPNGMSFTDGTYYYIIQPSMSTCQGQTIGSTSTSMTTSTTPSLEVTPSHQAIPSAPPVLSKVSVTSSPAAEAPGPKGNKPRWDTTRDLALLGEVVLTRPFQHKVKTPGRAKAWAGIATALQARGEKATQRSVRDRVRELMEKVKSTNRKERAANGIEVKETDDERQIREIVEDLLQEEKYIEAVTTTKNDERKKMAGAEMRKRACETFGESRKRQKEEGSAAIRRRSGNETLELMVKKMEMDRELRREELKYKQEQEEKRRVEDVERERRQEELQRQLLERQQQFQQQLLLQQQQAQQQSQQMQLFLHDYCSTFSYYRSPGFVLWGALKY